MIINTSELEGAALDWAVCMAFHGKDSREVWVHPSDDPGNPYPVKGGYRPSTDWAQGGPLIERYKMTLYQVNGPAAIINDDTGEHDYDGRTMVGGEGETILIAAMRAIVAAAMGDTVDVPEGLV